MSSRCSGVYRNTSVPLHLVNTSELRICTVEGESSSIQPSGEIWRFLVTPFRLWEITADCLVVYASMSTQISVSVSPDRLSVPLSYLTHLRTRLQVSVSYGLSIITTVTNRSGSEPVSITKKYPVKSRNKTSDFTSSKKHTCWHRPDWAWSPYTGETRCHKMCVCSILLSLSAWTT